MTDNVVDFPNEDEVISEEDQAEAEYNADAERGYIMGVEYRHQAYQIAEGLNNAEEDGFWEGFYG